MNKQGFSILEVMIALGLLSIVSLGVVRLSSLSTQSTISTRQSMDLINLLSQITSKTTDINGCTSFLRYSISSSGNNLLSENWPQILVNEKINLNRLAIDNSTTYIADVKNPKFFKSNLKIKSITLEISTGPEDFILKGITQKQALLKLSIISSKPIDNINRSASATQQLVSNFFLQGIFDPINKRLNGCYGRSSLFRSEEDICQSIGGIFDANTIPACKLSELSIGGLEGPVPGFALAVKSEVIVMPRNHPTNFLPGYVQNVPAIMKPGNYGKQRPCLSSGKDCFPELFQKGPKKVLGWDCVANWTSQTPITNATRWRADNTGGIKFTIETESITNAKNPCPNKSGKLHSYFPLIDRAP